MHPIIAEMLVTTRQQELSRPYPPARRNTGVRRHLSLRRRHEGRR